MKKAIFTIAALFALSTSAFASEVVKEDVKADLTEVMTLELNIAVPTFK